MIDPYNPLDKTNLGRSVAEALLLAPVAQLNREETGKIVGAGVYAIYYTGPFAPYAPVTARNSGGAFEQPIYVGKAVPKGARKGGMTFDSSTGTPIRDRLRQHASSINQGSHVDIADFWFRSLVVDDVWIPLGENMMIEIFQPIWNIVLDGFGNKTPGKGRENQAKSMWDMLHPGRTFTRRLPDGMPAADVEQRLADYFAGKAVPLVEPEDAVDEGAEDPDA